MKSKFTILIIAISLFSCTKRNLLLSSIDEKKDIIWNENNFQKIDLKEIENSPKVLINGVDVGLVGSPKKSLSLKQKVLTNVVERKLNKLKINQLKSISKNNEVNKNSKTASNWNWLWSTLLIAVVVVAALFITKIWGSIAGLIGLIALLVLLYLILPEDMANAMGQAAIIMAVNAVIQLLLSLL